MAQDGRPKGRPYDFPIMREHDVTEYPLLKDFINDELVTQIAGRIEAAQPSFDASAFIAAVVAELGNLELKARHRLIAAKLREFLPADYPEALRILLAMLQDEGSETPGKEAGLQLMSIPAFVEVYGSDHPRESLDAMPAITRVSSCEFALRPFLIAHPQATLARLRSWTEHEDEHVRRLVSEGSRPRLPWAPPLRQFIADPTPTLSLLERLKDDPSLYVRRSVANHLNDISKDHPGRVLELMEAWSPGASKERLWLINHGLRTLVKRGDRRALAILGFGPANVDLRDLELSPARLHFGDALVFSFELRNRGTAAAKLMIDYVMHFRKANGKTAPKVFKLKQTRLAAGAAVAISKKLAIRPISTRKYYAGRQRLEIQVNGRVLGGADFELVMD